MPASSDALDAALLSRPLSLSPQSSSLDGGSAATPTFTSTAGGRYSSFDLSHAPSEATTAVFPPPPVARTATLQLRPSHSLHSLLAKRHPAFPVAARALTASEAASEMISRGSCVRREEETKVDELLLETTLAFCAGPPREHDGAASTTTAPPQDASEDEEDADLLVATTTVTSSKGGSSGSRVSSPQHRSQGYRVTRPSLHLEASSTRTDTLESVETVESYDRQLRKIVSYELLSSPSLRSPNVGPTAAAAVVLPPPQHLISQYLYPVTPQHSRDASHALVGSPIDSPVGPNSAAQVSFTVEPEEPRSLMRFPAFVGLLDSVRSHSARSTRGGGGAGGGSVRSASKSRNGGSLLDTALACPSGPPVCLTAPPTHTPITTESASKRGKALPNGSALFDSPSRLSDGISGHFPALSPLSSASATATATAATASTGTVAAVAVAALSSEEVVAPAFFPPRSPSDGQPSSPRCGSRTRRQHLDTAATISDVITDPNFQPVGVNTSASFNRPAPGVQLGPSLPRHLHKVAQDGRAALQPLGLGESGRQSTTHSLTTEDAINHPTVTNLRIDALSGTGTHVRRLSAVLPPLSPQLSSGGNVHEVNVPSPVHARSVVCGREGVALSHTCVSPCSPARSAGQRTPLLGRFFREPKGQRTRVWVRAGSGETLPFSCSENQTDDSS